MEKVATCPACGEVVGAPRCPSCGVELHGNAGDTIPVHAAVDQDQTASDRDQTSSDQDQTWSDHDQTSIGLAAVTIAGVVAAAVIVALPRLAASRRALRFRLGRWLSPRTTSLRRASEAWALVSACWLVRAVAFFLLLGTLGLGFSVPLALLFLCAGAAGAALPIGPAGAATQVAAGTAALIASGAGASQALAAAISVGALGVLTGGVTLL